MVTRSFALAAALALATASTAPARADSPKLADARRAVEAVDYDAARRLLLEALRDGGNSPAAVGEIYRLLARAAVVLDDRNVAEQYYRRWLAIDPAAALPADAAPKLREPFIAAQSYIAAHGRLLARAQRAPTGEIDVEIVADPLAMARAARALDSAPSAPSPFGSDRRARLPSGARVAILDDNGNRLLELEPSAAPVAAATGASSTGTSSPTGQMPAPATSIPGHGRGAGSPGPSPPPPSASSPPASASPPSRAMNAHARSPPTAAGTSSTTPRTTSAEVAPSSGSPRARAPSPSPSRSRPRSTSSRSATSPRRASFPPRATATSAQSSSAGSDSVQRF
jgi:hypothetical protein